MHYSTRWRMSVPEVRQRFPPWPEFADFRSNRMFAGKIRRSLPLLLTGVLLTVTCLTPCGRKSCSRAPVRRCQDP